MDGNFFKGYRGVGDRNLSVVGFPTMAHFLLRIKLGFADLLLHFTEIMREKIVTTVLSQD